MPLPLADQLESWFATWMGSRLCTLLEGSVVPFEMPSKPKAERVTDGLLKHWQAQQRSWKILSLVQDACAQEWWIARSKERTEAIFEANKLLYHTQVLVSWHNGRLNCIDANDVHHERLAVEGVLKSSPPAQDTRSDRTTGPQKKGDVDWEASGNALCDDFIIPLLRGCGLCDVISCRSPGNLRRSGRSHKPSRLSHSTDLQGGSLEQRVLGELAEVYSDKDQAVMLLGKVGFPKERMPPFTSSLVFWTKVVEEARHGVLEGGASPIIKAAANLYPSNSAFTEYCRVLSSRATLSSTAPMIDIMGWYPSLLDHRRWVAVEVKRTIRASDVLALQQRIHSTFLAPIPERSGESIAEVWVIVTSYVSAVVRGRIFDGLDPVMKANVRLFDRSALEAHAVRASGLQC